MYPELTNLLPPSSSNAFRRGYFLRLATVGLCILSVLVVIHGVLLLPSYIFLVQSANAKTAELNRLSNSQQTTEEQEVQSKESSLQAETTYLSSFSNSPTASTALRAVLAVARPGIALTGFTYTPPSDGTPGNMQVTGVASTREALRSYDQLLSALPFVTNADLPISDYAAASDITFTITLTGSLKP